MTNIRTLVHRAGLAVAIVAATAAVSNAAVTFIETGVPFANPIGVAYHPGNQSLIVTANYPSGTPHSFNRIDIGGSTSQWSGASGQTDEVYLDIPRDNLGGFTPGEVFSGNGAGGQILRISADGSTVTSTWATLPGETGLFRGQLKFDNTGIFGHDLLATTTTGHVWRINSAGVGTMVATLGRTADFEGLAVVPNNPSRYGPLSGKIVVGDETSHSLWTVDTSGNIDRLDNVAPLVEALHVIPANERFVGVNYGTGRILYANSFDFAPYVGDLLAVEEGVAGGTTGLTRIVWNGTSFDQIPLALDNSGFIPAQWEGSTFAPYSVPAPASALCLGIAGLTASRRRRG
jgi:hypothetical protein